MTDNDNGSPSGTQEINPAQRGDHGSEVPMPEQKTGDVDSPPTSGQHLTDGMTAEENPAQPESERS